MIHWTYILSSTGARTQPCFTTRDTSKWSERSFPHLTRRFTPSCSPLTSWMKLGGQPHFSRSAQGSSLSTESNALQRSTKVMYTSRCCSRLFSISCLAAKIMCTVDLPAVKPHCVSGMIASETEATSLFSRILAITFPTVPRSAIPRLFPQMARSPLFL